jgi:hypothetical protein
VYEQADLVLSVSTFESFPSAIKEAASSGCLVIASQAGGIAEMMVDGANCILIDHVDPQAIAAAIGRAVSAGPDLSLALRRTAFSLACEEFHPRRAIHDLALCYNLCLEAAAGAGNRDIVEHPSRPPAGYVRLGHRLIYRLAPKRANWAGLHVLLGTHARPASGLLRVRVLADHSDPVREVAVELAGVRDNDWVGLRFAPIVNARGREFTVEFSLRSADANTRISLFEASPPEPGLRRLMRRAGVPLPGNSLYCRMCYIA